MRRLAVIAVLLAALGASFAAVLLLHRGGGTAVTVIHTVSYSNAAVFEAIGKHSDRIKRTFVPDPAKHLETLLSETKHGPAVSVTPFANTLIAADRNLQIRIIAGSGLNGISLVAANADAAADLKGKKIGTSKGDSLEIFAVELLEKAGVALGDYELVYFTDPFEAIEAIKVGKIDAVTHVEPFATDLVEDSGMHRVSTSDQLWGDHPDAVLVTTVDQLKRHRSELRWLVQTLQATEKRMKADPKSTAEYLSKSFYEMPSDKLLRILERQSPQIDIRKYEPFLRQRYETIRRLKYVDGPLRAEVFDWSLLE